MIIRRSLAFLLTGLLVIAVLATAVLAAGTNLAEDSFDSISYSGGSGWTSNWTEFGENNGSSSGSVRVMGGTHCKTTNCLLINTAISAEHGAWRSLDLGGADTATLTFTYKRRVFLLGVGSFEVQVSSDGTNYQTVGSYLFLLSDPDHQSSGNINIQSWASQTTRVRFLVTSLSLNSEVYIDDVAITATYPPTTTSTTTTSTTTSSTTTTTTEPIITVPTIPPILSTTTTTTSAVSSSTTTTTTSAGPTSSSTSTTTTTLPSDPDEGSGPGSGEPGPDDPDVLPPPSQEEVALAAESNVAIGLATGEDFGSFDPGFGINPLTDLGVRLNSRVEAISTEIMSALGLGAMIAFFGVRRIKDDES